MPKNERILNTQIMDSIMKMMLAQKKCEMVAMDILHPVLKERSDLLKYGWVIEKPTSHCFNVTVKEGRIVSVSVPVDANGNGMYDGDPNIPGTYETALRTPDRKSLLYINRFGYNDICRWNDVSKLSNELLRIKNIPDKEWATGDNCNCDDKDECTCTQYQPDY
jgi:hypothetical protein